MSGASTRIGIEAETVPRVARASRRDDERIRWGSSMPFLLLHVGALSVLWIGVTWELALACAGLYVVRMWGVTAGYHRYFSHRAFKTSRAFQFVLAFVAMTSSQKGVLWWASHHRLHHRESDTENDVHSPVRRGFWWSHVGWVLCERYEGTDLERVKDLARYPELVWLNRYWFVPPVALGAGLFLLGGLPLFVWGFVVSTVLLWHGTFLINSLAHVFGSRRYETSDASRNSFLLALLTLGEGWHNNHHHYQSSANQGFFWWEVDFSWYSLKVLSWLGLVWDLRAPPPSTRAAGRRERRLGRPAESLVGAVVPRRAARNGAGG